MMPSSLFTLVRFTVPEGSLHALLTGDRERRRALRDVPWGSRNTDAGEVLVTPPLAADKAAALRSLLAGAEGVVESDATGEYTLGYTNAPESYDGFGTLTLGTEADERLVAIRTEHLNWQVGRYASGLRRFRPASPPPSEEAASTAEAGAPAEAATAPENPGLGTVVHMRGRTRRYVVVRLEAIGQDTLLSMIALSGSVKGCYPTAVSMADVERNADQTVAFTGAAAATLRRKYDDARRALSPDALPMAS